MNRNVKKSISGSRRLCRGLLCFIAGSALSASAAPSFSVDEIHPPHWWTGMHDTTLQLQIHGENVRPADFSLSYPGVKVDSVVRLDGSPNWQYVYLTASPEARPGIMSLEWREGKRKVVKKYELRARRDQKGAHGFSA